MSYFGTIGFPCPRLTNPADFFMKLMNESGLILDEISQSKDNKIIDINQEELEQRFQKRVGDLTRGYNNSKMITACQEDINTDHIENKQHYQVSWFLQFWLILKRSLVNEVRNPLDVKSKFGQTIFFGLITIALYTPVNLLLFEF